MTQKTSIGFIRHVMRSLPARLSLIVLGIVVAALLSPAAYGWDSAPPISGGQRGYSTHSKMTRIAIAKLKNRYPELNTYKQQLLHGANLELHEKEVSYSDSLEKLRVYIDGTNEGLTYPDNLWRSAERQYRGKTFKTAFVYAGVLLHMIQDMGVPSHAWSIYHQSSILEPLSFDNFEALSGADNWKPDLGDWRRSNPNYVKPWEYYKLSRNWTRMDTRHWHGTNKNWNKKDRNDFPKTWRTANKKERFLLSTRQAWTAKVTEWALHSVVRAFRKIGPSTGLNPDFKPRRPLQNSRPKPRQNSAPKPRKRTPLSSAPRPR